MPDEGPAVQIDFDNGEIVRILIHEDYYEAAESLYNTYMKATEVVDIGVGTDLADIVGIADLPIYHEAMNHIGNIPVSVDAELQGVVISMNLIALLLWAAKAAVSIGKFTYKTLGYGEGGYGEGPYGGGPVVRESGD